MRRSTVWVASVCLLVSAACDGYDGSEPAGSAGGSQEQAATQSSPDVELREEPPAGVGDIVELPVPAPTLEQRVCRADRLESRPLVLLTGTDPANVASRVAHRTHRCAPTVVVAPVDGWAASLAVPVAAAHDAPLLLVRRDDPPRTTDVLTALETTSVVGVGVSSSITALPGFELVAAPSPPPGPGDEAGLRPASPRSPDVRLALRIADHLDTRTFLAVAEDDVRGRTAAALRADAQTALLPIPGADDELEALARALPSTARVRVVDGPAAGSIVRRLLAVGLDAEIAEGDRWPPGGDTSWLVDPDDPNAGAVAAVAAAGRGEALLPIDGADLRAGAADAARLRDTAPERAVVVGAVTPHALWQYEVVRDGEPLPSGSFRLFDNERMVSLADVLETADGPPDDAQLDAAVVRLAELSEPFDEDGQRVLPTLEVDVTSILDALTSSPPEDLLTEPFGQVLERSAQEGIYLVLRLPDDTQDAIELMQGAPQLFLAPNTGASITVAASWDDEDALRAELQPVADQLARLTRDARLPQKLLLVRSDVDDELLDTGARPPLTIPPELAVVVEMDSGTGPSSTSDELHDGLVDSEPLWRFGWRHALGDQQLDLPEELLAAEVAIITFS